MKTLVVAYSWTGNNRLLAELTAAKINADLVFVEEKKRRSMLTILFDKIFQRLPAIRDIGANVASYDRAVLVSPVWMGKISTPMRSFITGNAGVIRSWALLSIGGGADGPNPEFLPDIVRMMGRQPDASLELHLARLFPADYAVRRKDTMARKIRPEELEKNFGHALDAFCAQLSA